MNVFNKEYKGWPWERVARHVLYWTFWLTFYGVVNGSYYGEHYADWFIFELVTMTVKLPYTYFTAYYLFPRFLPKGKYGLLAASVLGFAFLGMLALMALYQVFPYPFGATEFWSTKTVYMFVDLIYVASPVVVIKIAQQYLKQEQAAARLREEKTEAELQMLKNQLQPHFLFNTLNNIYGMLISTETQAGEAILKLSDMLGYMLYECNADRVSLEKEVTLIRNYFALERLRYGDRPDLAFDSKGDVSRMMVPPLLFMPFVENAFKHGVAQDEKHPWIRVHIRAEDNRITFLCENSIPATPARGSLLTSGIGLENVKKRLTLIYPGRHSLQIVAKDSYLVTLRIEA